MESTSGRAKSRENGKLLPFSHFSSHPAGPMQSGRFPNLPSQVVIEEEQPSWLDDLLSDTRTLFYRGHRRSASDSCAYLAAEAFVLDDESDFVNAYFGSPPGPKNMDTKVKLTKPCFQNTFAWISLILSFKSHFWLPKSRAGNLPTRLFGTKKAERVLYFPTLFLSNTNILINETIAFAGFGRSGLFGSCRT